MKAASLSGDQLHQQTPAPVGAGVLLRPMSEANGQAHVRLMKSVRRLGFAGVALALIGAAFPLQAFAAAPTFTGCTNIDDYVQWESDSGGRWVAAFIKYRCNSGKSYTFQGQIFQDISVGGFVTIGGHSGVDTAPWAGVGTAYCTSSASTNYKVVWDLTIAGVHKQYVTKRYTLPCYAEPNGKRKSPNVRQR